MNAIVKSKVFRSGNSVAVRLPKDFGFDEGTDITLEKRGTDVFITPAIPKEVDPEAALANNRALVEEIRAIWARHGGLPKQIGKREPFEAPDRPGLL